MSDADTHDTQWTEEIPVAAVVEEFGGRVVSVSSGTGRFSRIHMDLSTFDVDALKAAVEETLQRLNGNLDSMVAVEDLVDSTFIGDLFHRAHRLRRRLIAKKDRRER